LAQSISADSTDAWSYPGVFTAIGTLYEKWLPDGTPEAAGSELRRAPAPADAWGAYRTDRNTPLIGGV
jgi:hypothetical protein